MDNVVDLICQRKLMAVLRNIGEDDVLGVARALYDGGIRMIAITFDQTGSISDESTVNMIKRVREMFGRDMIVGAGTVLTLQQVKLSKDGGAVYVMSPDTNIEVIKKAKALGMVPIPGVATSTEILAAKRSGAEVLMLFPSSALGSDYLKSVLKPFAGLKLMSIGGINLDNMKEFLDSGACAVGINSGIVDPESVEKKDYKEIERRARMYTQVIANN